MELSRSLTNSASCALIVTVLECANDLIVTVADQLLVGACPRTRTFAQLGAAERATIILQPLLTRSAKWVKAKSETVRRLHAHATNHNVCIDVFDGVLANL